MCLKVPELSDTELKCFYLSIPWQLIHDGEVLSILEQVNNCFGLGIFFNFILFQQYSFLW